MASVRSGVRLVLAALLFLSGLGFSSGTARARAGVARKDQSIVQARRERAAAFAALRKRLQEGGGQVRVIVQLNTAFTPEADLPAMEALDQRTAIDRAAGSLEAELGTAAEAFESLDRLPIAILVADAQVLTVLQNSPRVLSIQEDVPEQMQLAESTALIGASGTFGAHAAGYTGAGYAVAILDVGVDKLHPFLSGRVVAEACFSTSYSGSYTTTTLCPNGQSEQHGTDAARPCSVNNLDPLNACDHGTHVAGIAAGHNYATMVSAGQATALYNGVAPDASIIAVQVFSRMDTASQCGGVAFTPCYLTFPSDQLRALNWLSTVASTYNLASINMSLGGTTKYTSNCDSDTRKVGFDNLRAAGVVTFIAAGNSGWTDGVSAPGCVSSVVTVGSTRDGGPAATPADSISSFSNSSALVEMWAPGEWIQSSTLNSKFTLKAGTSMATPHVAGGYLVFKQMYPADGVDALLSRLYAAGVLVTDPRNGITKPRLALNTSLPSGFSDSSPVGFGSVVVDLGSDRIVTFENTGNLAVSLTGPVVTGTGFAFKGGVYPGTGGTCGSSLAAHATCTLVLRFAPAATGSVTGQLAMTYGTNLTATLALNAAGRQLCPANRVSNAVFESGAAWSQTTTAGPLPLRTTAVSDGTGPALPSDGSGWARFGGYTAGGPTITQAITQSVTIPAGSASLEFVVDISRADAGASSSHTFQATLDGNPVFSLNALSAGYSSKQVVRLDVGAYANGGAHVLGFQAVTPANGPVVNFNLDAVGLCAPAFYPNFLAIMGHE